MHLSSALTASLLTPMVLAFVLGIIAALIKSDLELPKDFYAALTIYLLFAIGLKGGAKLSSAPLAQCIPPSLAALGLGLAIPLWCYAILRRAGGFDPANAAALAAHYGSVSAVTFSTVLVFLDNQKTPYEPFLPALLAMLEVPAILVAIFLYKRSRDNGDAQAAPIGPVLRELFSGKSIVLLVGGTIIGWLGGHAGFEQVAAVFDTPFKGVLCLFLLELGLVTGARLGDLRKAGVFLAVFALVMPILHGMLGIWLGKISGLGLGGPDGAGCSGGQRELHRRSGGCADRNSQGQPHLLSDGVARADLPLQCDTRHPLLLLVRAVARCVTPPLPLQLARSAKLMNTRRFKIIEGAFTAEDAGRVLLSLVRSKMDFHRLERFSNEERFGQDSAHSERRLAELERLQEEIKEYCQSAAAENQPLQIDGWIEITMPCV